MRLALRIVLWGVAGSLLLFGLLSMLGALDTSGTDPAGRGLNQAFGCFMVIIGGGAAAALFLARFWRGWVVIGALILAVPLVLAGIFFIRSNFENRRQVREREEMHSGRTDFGEQPTLAAVAEAISRNDEAGIRAAAKNVPDLQAAGRDGKTLLFFAVDEAMERPQLATAVETLLSLGANPNYNNGNLFSFALAHAVSGEVRLLRIMLDAGGDPNGTDSKGQPIVFGNWHMSYNEQHRPDRLRLLLDRGTDVNSTRTADAPLFAGYTLLLFRANKGRGDSSAYADALELLERGADLNRAAPDGTTLAQMLREHRDYFRTTGNVPSPEFERLWAWLAERSVLERVP